MSVPFVLLGDVVTFKGGGTPDRKVDAYWNGGVPWASVKDFKSAELSATLETISEDGLKSSASNLIPQGTVIVPTRMAVGKAAISNIDLAINQDLKALFPKEQLDARYLLHVLLASGEKLERYATGATVKGITLDVLRGLEIPLPPLPEQRRIAAILDQADALRRLRRQSLSRLSDLGQAIFFELFGDTNIARARALSEFITFVTSGGRGWAQYYADEGERFIRSLDVQMGYISDGDKAYVRPPNSAEARRTRVQDRDVLLTITGSRIGRVACIPADFGTGFVSQHVAIIRLDSTKIVPEYVAFFLAMESGGQRQIARSQYGQTKPGLNFEQIGRFEIPVPSLERQYKFLEILQNMRDFASKVEARSDYAEYLFASLQHRAFRGEL